jgi:hypothetical protein
MGQHRKARFRRATALAEIILPQGFIAWRWYSNIQVLEGKMPDELTALMKRAPNGTRANRDLSDQFSYAFVKAGDGDLAAYFATFRLSFAMLGIVSARGTPLSFRGTERNTEPLAPETVRARHSIGL